MNKKILIIASYSQSLMRFRLQLMRQFVLKDYAIVACAPDFDISVISKLHDQNITFEQINIKRATINLLNDLRTSYALYKLFKKHQPDIVFGYTIKPVIYGSLAAKLAGVKSIYSIITGLGYVFTDNSKKAKILRYIVEKLYTITLQWNNKVFFQNPDDLKLFCEKNLIDNNKAVLINGSGVDIKYYLPESFPKKCTFLFIGRFIKDKGINEYISAAKKIKALYPKVIVQLAGYCDDNPNSLSEHELKLLISTNTIEFLGFLEDVRLALKNCSVFVLPSYREGTPRAVLEAMACGRPIITTDAPGCRETVRNGVNGFLVPIKNIQCLANAMEKFIINPELITQMGKESRRIAEEKYDVTKVNKVILGAMNI